MNDNQQRMTFGQFVDKVLWSLIALAGGSIALTVSDLNVKMAVVVQEVQFHERRISNLEQITCQPNHSPSKGSR